MALENYIRLLLPKSSEHDKIGDRAYARLPILHGSESDGSVTSEKSLSEQEEDPLVSGLTSRRSRGPKLTISTLLPWILVAVFTTSTVLLILHPLVSKANWDFGSYEKGWALEFTPALETIQLEQHRFSGSPIFDDNGSYYVANPSAIQYAGQPSSEIDKAWDDLVFGRYFLITEEEAKDTFGDPRYKDFWNEGDGGYVTGLEVLHTLHCVNQVRMALHQDYYTEHAGNPRNGMHWAHCIDQIRQYVMCHGDLTPIPTRWYSALGHNYADSNMVHTCRNFQAIRDWVSDRFMNPIVPPQPRGWH